MSIERDLAREDIAIASLPKRIKAYILDEMLIAIIMTAALSGKFNETQDAISHIMLANSYLLWIITLRFFYQLIFVSIYGATLGKMWQGTTIISIATLDKPSFFTAFSRAAIATISGMCLGYGFLWAFFNPLRQTWHDKISGTIVVDV